MEPLCDVQLKYLLRYNDLWRDLNFNTYCLEVGGKLGKHSKNFKFLSQNLTW